MKVDEKSFERVLTSEKPALVFFYREKGCSFCAKMKPVVAEYEKAHPEVAVFHYELGGQPDSITLDLVKNFPTFAAYVDGKLVATQEGVLTVEGLHLTFSPDLIPPKQIPIENASMLMLMTDEANLIDKIYPLKVQLSKVQAEIKKRKSLISGGDEPCCDSCAEGGGCSGGCS
jgi:thiol-disulfide isomerase/thioredoxin